MFKHHFKTNTTSTRSCGISDKINNAFEPVSKAVSDVIFYSVPVVGTDVPIVLFVLLMFSKIEAKLSESYHQILSEQPTKQNNYDLQEQTAEE